MSRSYDDRIVRMGFDNAKFESGARQTMSTLDKLNDKLKLKGAAEGSANVQKSVDSVDFSSMEKAILNIEKRFSTLGVVSMNVINKITDGITGSVARLEQATIGQIKSGGWARAMNIANAKFQIEGLGFAWEEVEKAVSYGVKDTAYGLDAAASAASQLAASGVDFREVLDVVNGQELTAMHKSLRAISGVAAMTNSSYEDIARIFTTVAGNGRLMGDQLLQLSTRGMNVAAKLAETLGTTEGEIREMVSRGLIDFQTFAFAMDNAFGDHAKEANKTFTGALGNMKAALSRVGEIFADPIINKTNTLFISLTSRIDEFKNKLKSIKVPRTLEEIEKKYHGISNNAAAYEATLNGMGDRTIKLGEDFANMWQSGIDAFSAMIKSVDLEWFDKIVEKVDTTVNKITEFFDLINEIYGESSEEAADSINEATNTLLVSAEEAQAAKDIILKGAYGNGDARKNALTELFGGGEEGKKHAENVQAYIDSVVAAGWSFENAAMQVESANEIIAESDEQTERQLKKERLKKILNEVATSFSNLWTTAKNLGKAAGKIVKSILNAFSGVFKIDFGTVTDGVSGFTGVLANLSEKLIISDDAAEIITGVLKHLFDVVKSGGTVLKNAGDKAWTFVKSLGDSKRFKDITDGIDKLYGKIKAFATGDGLDASKDGIASIFEGFSFENIGTSVSNFFDAIQNAFDGIKLPDSIKNNTFFESINDFIDKSKEILSDDTDIPTKIGSLINAIIDTVNNIEILDAGKVALTVWGIVSIAKIFFALDDIGDAVRKAMMLPVIVSKMINNLGIMFKNLGNAAVDISKAMVIKAAATAILEIIGSLIIISQIPADDIYRAATILIVIVGSLAILMKMFGKMSGYGAGLKVTLVNITAFASNLLAVGFVITSVGGAIMLVASAFGIISKTVDSFGEDGLNSFKSVMTIMFLAIGGLMVLGVELRKAYNPLTSILPIFAGMALVISSLGGSIFAVASAMAIIGTLKQTGFEHALETIATVMFSLVAIFAIVGAVKVSPGQMVGMAVAMMGFAGAMAILAVVISTLAVLPASEGAVEATKALVGISLLMMAGIAAMSKAFSGGLGKAVGLIAGVLAMQLIMTTMIGALLAVTTVAAANPEALSQAAKTMAMMVLVAGLITAILGIGAALSGKKEGGDDALLAVGTAFVMVAGGIYILAAAITMLTEAVNNPGFAGAIVVIVAFVAIVGVLIGLTVAFSAVMIPALEAVGNALLKSGAGFALVGAGVFLVCAGIKMLVPAVAILAVNLGALFEVIENHWAATLIVIVAAIAVGFIIMKTISALGPVLLGICGIVSTVVSTIGSLLSAGTAKLKKWGSGLSTKGKVMIVGIITTLCAAILKASPQVLNTVGQLLIKLLAYLGKIAGDLAMGLLDFLINLIDGLADAIRMNSNRIVAALYGVLGSLLVLATDVFRQLFRIMFGEKIGDWIGEHLGLDLVTESVNEGILEMRKSAEEADKAKQDYRKSVLGIADSTEEAADKSGSIWDSLTKKVGKNTDEQSGMLDSLGDKYANTIPDNLAEYMQIKYTSNPGEAKSAADDSMDSFMSEFVDATKNGETNEGVSVDELMSQYGMSKDDFGMYGEQSATTYTETVTDGIDQPDEYYDASDSNMKGGVQQAIEDNEKPTVTAVREHINEPAAQAIREGRRGYYEAAEYAVTGAISYIDKVGSGEYVAAMVRLAKSGNTEYNKENEINSPSKLYYRNGAYIVEGLVNGIEQNTDNAAGAMGSLSQAVMAAFGNPIDYVSRIASGELVYDTSIRPVFDGSSVYKGASSINSMLNGQTMTVAGFSGKLATDIGALDKSNLDVVNEIRALREDIAALGEEMAEMQIVMDTGALVGATVGPMDKALGAKSIRYRRG